MAYYIDDVTDKVDLWFNKDPVRPELDIKFRTHKGRSVFGLHNEQGEFKSFICISRTVDIPKDTKELEEYTSESGSVVVPYSVWSYERGAGREVVNRILSIASEDDSISRVVTLSPKTDMARKFHIKNKAIELSVNDTTVNFEYLL